jgi:hypothetical protein
MGSRQVDALRAHGHSLPTDIFYDATGDRLFTSGGGQRIASNGPIRSTTTTGESETRPANVAFHPRIHA